MTPETKLAQIRRFYALGDTLSVLRIAARFPRLGEHRDAITKGWAAHQNPDFYRQLGVDPEPLVCEALLAIKQRYKL